MFQDQKLRSHWDEEKEKWYFSVIDVVAVLTESLHPNNYWKVLKSRLKKEGSQLVTDYNQLKMQSSDGKYYKTDMADTEQLLRLIQSIPSKKARLEIEKQTGKSVITNKNVDSVLDRSKIIGSE